MPAATFGRRALNDGNFVGRLRQGRGLTSRTHARLQAFMRDHPARTASPAKRRGRRKAPDLAQTIRRLRAAQNTLRAEGIEHVAVFGSVARGEARTGSDIDLLIEVSPRLRPGLFAMARMKRFVADAVPDADVVDRPSLDPAIAERVLADAVYAF
jgi:hypothetical protein